MLTQKHLFLILSRFCLTMWILSKTQKVHMSLPLSRACYKHALNLQDQTLLQRQPQPYTAFAQYRFMPELIKLWKKSNRRSKQVVKLHRAPVLHPFFPLWTPKRHLSMQLHWPAALPFNPTHRKIWTFGLSGPLRETLTEPLREGWKHRQTAQVFGAFTFFKDL